MISVQKINGFFPNSIQWSVKLTENMEKYELGIAVQKVYDFLWDELCDWYIEMAKVRLWKQRGRSEGCKRCTLDIKNSSDRRTGNFFIRICHLSQRKSTAHFFLKKSLWSPTGRYTEDEKLPGGEKAEEGFKEVVRGIRNTRTEMNVPNKTAKQAFTS